MKRIFNFIKKEPVFCAACLLMLASAFFVVPNKEYFGYVDYKVLALLFCLMAVVAGLKEMGLFDRIASSLSRKVTTVRSLTLLLSLVCFLVSMVITNDVSLITFVPLTVLMLKGQKEEDVIRAVVIETIAANLGSCLTPIGNPQNLFLYGFGGYEVGAFLLDMLPVVAVSLVAVVLLSLLTSGEKLQVGEQTVVADEADATDAAASTESEADSLTEVPRAANGTEATDKDKIPTAKLIMYLLLFAICLLEVFHVLHFLIVLAVVLVALLIFDRKILLKVDYMLLATFIAFFVFIGNLGQIQSVRGLLEELLAGREILVGIAASQVFSNVPAAMLLAEFSTDIKGLLWGVNIGGLGTLIASMASLISYKIYANRKEAKCGKYMGWFSLYNFGLLALFIALVVFLGWGQPEQNKDMNNEPASAAESVGTVSAEDNEMEANANQTLQNSAGGKITFEACKPTGAPVEPVYEIDELPAMDNKLFAEWDGKIYFRRYNADCFEHETYGYGLREITDKVVYKDLMCMDEEGNVTCVGRDMGTGTMYIEQVDDEEPRLYSVCCLPDNNWKIYSCNLDGSNVKIHYECKTEPEFVGMWGRRLVFQKAGELKFVYIANDFDVSVCDVPCECIGWDEEAIYYVYWTDARRIYFEKFYYTGEVEQIAELAIEDLFQKDGQWVHYDIYESLGMFDLTDIEMYEDKIYFMLRKEDSFNRGVGIYILDMNDGTVEEVVTDETGSMGRLNVVKDEDNLWLYYGLPYLVEDGEEYKELVDLNCVQIQGTKEAGTEVYPWLEKGTVDTYLVGEYGIYATPDDTGVTYVLASCEELESLGIGSPRSNFENLNRTGWDLVRAEYIGNKLFFSVEISELDPERSYTTPEGTGGCFIWQKTYDYCKDLSTGEYTLLNSY